ncbi:hypothetical protein POM88_052210 [Heracleum sosnowskyi]|uniref:Uncharacterized protein n=1 Tax=Heracleum sosnowskyi TaxID=360622 RepID=A0AAD8GTG1_9APIA|nr:hypothetical protein POM88_052210 [Heracleum sosnowskyi]
MILLERNELLVVPLSSDQPNSLPSQVFGSHRHTRDEFELEAKYYNKTSRGLKLLKTIRFSHKHVNQDRWSSDDLTGAQTYEYANINEENRTDVLYKDRKKISFLDSHD